MHPVLFDYQNKALKDSAELYRKGYKKVLHVSPGGSGKTIMMSSKTFSYLAKGTGKKVAFFTHRDELFNQSREKMLLFDIITEPINADTSFINPNAKVLVVMVETFDRRSDSESFLNNFKDVGLVFIDEAHRTDFDKIMKHFEGCMFSGWTATPVSANKITPLNTIWDVMIEVALVTQLQYLNSVNPKVGVVPSDCYSLGKIDRSKLKVKGQEFDEKSMSKDFSSGYQITNTLENYFSYGKDMKGLCFNCDISHNEIIHNEFLASGVPSRMLHSDRKKWFGAPSAGLAKNWRKDTLLWLNKTPGAILNNVGILTTGFDEPSIELIMVNHSTKSISRYIQEIVRGARPYQYPNGKWKELYRLLDFGQNAKNFGDGNNDLPWMDYFLNPASVSTREGVGGVKTCPECGNMNPVGSRFCQGLRENFLLQEFYECGYEFPLSQKEEDLVPRMMVKHFNDNIDVAGLILIAKRNGYKVESVYFKILKMAAELASKNFGTMLLSEQFDFILDICCNKLKELSKVTGKRTFKQAVKENLIPFLRQNGFVLEVDELGDETILNELKMQ